MEVKQFPRDMSALEVDKRNPRRCLVHGLFEEQVEVGGVTRKFYTYITPGLLYNQRCVVVAPPDDTPVLDWLENSFWTNFADKAQVFLYVMVPAEGGWNTDGSDAEYMNKVYREIHSRKYYVTFQDNVYAVGIGKGAIIAQQATMKMTSDWSGLATFGEMDAAALLNATATAGAENTGATELVVSGAKAQLPVWMAWSENTSHNAAVCEYWKRQNDVDPEPYASKTASEIYFPSTVCKKSQINEEKISQVRVTNGFDGEPDAALWQAVWTYISKAYRHRSFGVKALRNYQEPEAYGIALRTLEHEGYTRTWYEYVPDSVKNSATPVPLVVCMHGRGGSAESFISLSGMNRVAEERGFIVLFPEAGLYQQRPGGLRNIVLWNGSYKDEPIDDVSFVLKAIDDVKARYNVDAGRVYACGQSSGGMMTATLAQCASQVFAAVAPWSALTIPPEVSASSGPAPITPEASGSMPKEIASAVPYLFMFGDKDWLCADPETGELEYKVSKNIAAYLKNLMKIYGLNEKPLHYVCGEISYYIYHNAQGVPMLKVGVVSNMPHANYPRESWIAYDEFLCKFSKTADGKLYYMGEEVLYKAISHS